MYLRHSVQAKAVNEYECGKDGRFARRNTASQIIADRSKQVGLRHRAALPPKHPAVTKQHEGWHRPYPISCGCMPVFVNIHLYYTQPVAKLRLQLLHYKVHHLARLAPYGEKVDQHKPVG